MAQFLLEVGTLGSGLSGWNVTGSLQILLHPSEQHICPPLHSWSLRQFLFSSKTQIPAAPEGAGHCLMISPCSCLGGDGGKTGSLQMRLHPCGQHSWPPWHCASSTQFTFGSKTQIPKMPSAAGHMPRDFCWADTKKINNKKNLITTIFLAYQKLCP